MHDARGDACLVQEHLHETRLFEQMRMDALERDEAVEAGAGGHASEVDRRHSPVRDLEARLVAIDGRPVRVTIARCFASPSLIHDLEHEHRLCQPGAPRGSRGESMWDVTL